MELLVPIGIMAWTLLLIVVVQLFRVGGEG
jgi:hypothetical protein